MILWSSTNKYVLRRRRACLSARIEKSLGHIHEAQEAHDSLVLLRGQNRYSAEWVEKQLAHLERSIRSYFIHLNRYKRELSEIDEIEGGVF